MGNKRPRAHPLSGSAPRFDRLRPQQPARPQVPTDQIPRLQPLPRPAEIPGLQPRAERQVAFRLGLSAESRAAALLIAKGFRILARRWKSPFGEIDIIARRRRLLVFVEVKARENFDDAA
jgi:hypothetical protein